MGIRRDDGSVMSREEQDEYLASLRNKRDQSLAPLAGPEKSPESKPELLSPPEPEITVTELREQVEATEAMLALLRMDDAARRKREQEGELNMPNLDLSDDEVQALNDYR